MKEICSALRALVVDDHMMMRTMITQNLEKLGFRNIDTAGNGEEALDKIKTSAEIGSPYHLLMLDWHMPVMEGIEVLKTCRQNTRYDNMAVVMLTAEKEERNVLQAIEAGATSYLVKPVAFDALQKNLEKTVKWLEKRGVDIDSEIQKKKDVSDSTNDLPELVRVELEPVIAKGLEHIFSELFHVEIVPDDFVEVQDEKDMVCVGYLFQEGLTISLRFFFNQKLLTPLLRQIYSQDYLQTDEAYADAACEIVNILCAQVKSFLNKKDYDFEMGLPEAALNISNKEKQADSYLNVSFSLNETDSFLVDVNTTN